MSVERIHRLLQLIMVLQAGRARSADELADEVGVSRRTLFRYLKMLQAAGIPCYHDNAEGYRIARGFFLPPISLTVSETLGLMLLGKTSAGLRNKPMIGPALAAIHKLTATVPDPIRQACADMMAHVSVNPGATGQTDAEQRYYHLLSRCIDEHRACAMRYRSPVEPAAIDCTLEPYALHFAARAWYVLGRTDVHPEVRIFKLLRIQQLTPTEQRFRRPARFDPADHLGQAWQLIPEGTVHSIELEFTAKVGTNVAEVRWHPSQKHKLLPDGRCLMSFEIDGLEEIAWWLCGYAGQVRILKPAALRQRVIEKHRQAMAMLDHAQETARH